MTDYYPGFIQDASGAWVAHPQAYQPIPGTTAGVDTGTILQGSVSYNATPTAAPSVVSGATQTNSGYTSLTPTYGNTTPTTLQGGVQTTQVPLSTELGQANYPQPAPQYWNPQTYSYQSTPYVPSSTGSTGGFNAALAAQPPSGGVYGTNTIAAPGNNLYGGVGVSLPGYYLQVPTTGGIGTSPGAIGAFNPSLYPNGISILPTNPNDPGSLQYLQAQAAATQAANPAPDARFLPGGIYYGADPATTGQPMTQAIAVAINQNPTAYAPNVVQNVNGQTGTTLQGGVTNNYYYEAPPQLTPQQQLVKDVQSNMFAAMDSSRKNIQMPNIPQLPNAINPFGEMPGAAKFHPSQLVANDPSGGGQGYPGMQQAQYDNQPSNPYQGGLSGPAQAQATPPQGQQPQQKSYGFPANPDPRSPGFDPNNVNNKLGQMWDEQYRHNQQVANSAGQRIPIPAPPQPRGWRQRLWQATASPDQLSTQARNYQNLVNAIEAHNKAIDARQQNAQIQQRQLLESAMTMQNTGNRIQADQENDARKQREVSDAEYRQAKNDLTRNFPKKGVEQDAAIMRQMRDWKGRTRNGQPVDISDWEGDYPYDQANLQGKDDRHQAAVNARSLFESRKAYAEHQASLIGKRDRDYDELMTNKKNLAKLNEQIKQQQLATATYKLTQEKGIKSKLNEDKHELNQARLVEMRNQATDKLRVTANQTIGRYTDLLKAISLNPDLVGEENKPKLEAYLKTTYGADGLVKDGAGGLMPKAVVESFRTLGDTPDKIKKLEQEFGQTINQIRMQAGQTEQLSRATKALNPEMSPQVTPGSIQSFRNQEQKKIESAFGKPLEQLRSSKNPIEMQAVQMFDQRTFGSAPASNLAPIAAPQIKRNKPKAKDNVSVETINVKDGTDLDVGTSSVETINLIPIRPKKKA